jgi:hypothetical protein
MPSTAAWIPEYHWGSIAQLIDSYIMTALGDTFLGPILAGILGTTGAAQALTSDVQTLLNAFGSRNTGLERSAIITLVTDAANYIWNTVSLSMKMALVGVSAGNYMLGFFTAGFSEGIEEDINVGVAAGQTVAVTVSLMTQYDAQYNLPWGAWIF